MVDLLISDLAYGSGTTLFSTGTHTTNWTGIWASPQAGNVVWSLIGKFCTIKVLANVIATSNAAANITVVNALPSNIRPVVGVSTPLLVISTTTQIGEIIISTAGAITIERTLTNLAFASGVSAGFYAFSLTYLTA